MRALLETFVSSSNDLAYVTLLNSEAKGISAGRIAPDAFLRRELERAYAAASQGRAYNGPALVVGNGKAARTVILVSTPVMYSGHFLGMIGTVVDLQFLIRRLQVVQRGGLTPYVVDSEGRLVAGVTPDYVTGQDMTDLEIVKAFVEQGSKAQLIAATREFNMNKGKENVDNARHLQSSAEPGLGGDCAKAARRSVQRRFRNATYRAPAGPGRSADQHRPQHLCGGAHHASA